MNKIIYPLIVVICMFCTNAFSNSVVTIENQATVITACATPQPYLVSINGTTASIAWHPTDAINYKVDLYKKINGTYVFQSTGQTPDTSYTFLGLTTPGEYQAKVFAFCTNKDLSDAGIIYMKTVIQDDIVLGEGSAKLQALSYNNCAMSKEKPVSAAVLRTITLSNNQIYRVKVFDLRNLNNYCEITYMYDSQTDILHSLSRVSNAGVGKVVLTSYTISGSSIIRGIKYTSGVAPQIFGGAITNVQPLLQLSNFRAYGTGSNNSVLFDLNFYGNTSYAEAYCQLSNGNVLAQVETGGGNLRTIVPNPVSSEAKMIFSMNEESQGDISIYDITGRFVQSISKNQAFYKGDNDFKIQVSDLQRGIYFLEIKTPKERIMCKFVKQ
jgi:hypothetical protein